MESQERPLPSQSYQSEIRPLEEGEPKPVLAAQHIYTRVPIRQSPSYLEGWQSYRYTKTGASALSVDDVRRIEGYLEYQGNFERRGKRWQFFPLDEKHIVFTRVVPRSETDRGGLAFLHLDHSLIVPISDIGKLPDGLLSLWDDVLYVNELEELPLEKGIISGNIPAKNLNATERGSRKIDKDEIPAELARLAQNLPADQLVETLETQNAQPLADLVRLMVNAKELVENRYRVCLCGSRGTKGEIEQVLKLAIRMAKLMSNVDETSLSFTTWIPDEGTRAPFWAVGVSQPPRYWWDTNYSRGITLFASRVLDSVRSIGNQPAKELTAEEIRQQQLSHQSVMNALDKMKHKEPEVPITQPTQPKITGFLKQILRRLGG